MDRYEPKEITKMAKETAKDFPAMSGMENPAEKLVFIRCPRQGRGFKPNDRIKMKTMGKEMVQLNRENIDLRYVEQLADTEQVSALGYCVRYAEKHLFQGKDTIQNVVDKLEEKICREGLSSLCESNASVANLAMPRRQEIFACLNRYRGLNL